MEMVSPFSDPVMRKLHYRVWEELGPLPEKRLLPLERYFWELCSSIIGQQLSEKVAPKIEARVMAVLKNTLTPAAVLQTDIEKLRAAGLSHAKIQYLKNVASAWKSGAIQSETLANLSDEDVIEQLICIKGVGRWTAEMFLIFTLGRPDVFSPGDYGLRRAMIIAYGLPKELKPPAFAEIAQHWSPHRSLASRVLWKSLELVEQH